MSILLSSTRIKGVQFDFYPDGVEVRYSLCIKNILADILRDEINESHLGNGYIFKDVDDYDTHLVPSKHNWYLTKRRAYSYILLPKNLFTLAKEYREALEKYRNELYVRFEDKIKQRLFDEFSKHRELPSNEEPCGCGVIDELPY